MPLRPVDNRPHVMLGRGWSFATVGSTNVKQIVRWWSGDNWHRFANIGVITGEPNSLVVIDCDKHRAGQDGIAVFAQWCADHRVPLDGVPYVDTPSGGRHYYFRNFGPLRSFDWFDGVEVKADGRMVAAPPSVREQVVRPGVGEHPRDAGVVYVEYAAHGDLFAPPVVPDALLAELRKGPVSKPGAGGTLDEGGVQVPGLAWWIEQGGFGALSGSRDKDCLAFARSLLNRGTGEDAVRGSIRAVWNVTTQAGHPFPWSQAEKCISQARRYWSSDDWGWRG